MQLVSTADFLLRSCRHHKENTPSWTKQSFACKRVEGRLCLPRHLLVAPQPHFRARFSCAVPFDNAREIPRETLFDRLNGSGSIHLCLPYSHVQVQRVQAVSSCVITVRPTESCVKKQGRRHKGARTACQCARARGRDGAFVHCGALCGAHAVRAGRC